MLSKFELIWMRIGQVIRLQNDINFSETPCILNEFKFLQLKYIEITITIYTKWLSINGLLCKIVGRYDVTGDCELTRFSVFLAWTIQLTLMKISLTLSRHCWVYLCLNEQRQVLYMIRGGRDTHLRFCWITFLFFSEGPF